MLDQELSVRRPAPAKRTAATRPGDQGTRRSKQSLSARIHLSTSLSIGCVTLAAVFTNDRGSL